MPGVEVLRTDRSWIKKTPHVCGGDACIRDTRITVWGLVESKRLGLSDAAILHSIVGLTPADLEAAWAYYEQHREEIESVLREEAEA
jgi:type III restriction enzyme